MEFTINCPIDGSVEVGLEDIDTVVLREPERADITFVCPHCGTAIAVTAIVPAFLLSAIEALAEDSGAVSGKGFVVLGSLESVDDADTPVIDDAGSDSHVDAYCEYFRRQLESIQSADDVLSEIDSSRPSA